LKKEDKMDKINESIPLSKGAEFMLWWKGFSELSKFDAGLIPSGILSFVATSFTIASAVSGENWLIPGSIDIVCLSVLGIFLFLRRKKKAEIRAEVEAWNKGDWEGSKRIDEMTQYLMDHPPVFNQHGKAELLSLEGLTPVRIDYTSDTEIEGTLSGSFRGSGFGLIAFSFRGEFEGSMKGRTTPDLIEQHAVVICTDKDGSSFRLVFPSSTILKAQVRRYFLEIIRHFPTTEGDGWKRNPVYSTKALLRMQEFVISEMSKINYQRIVDFLATQLDLPQDERTKIGIRGKQIKEGIIIVSSVECGSKGIEAVIPADFMLYIQERFRKANESIRGLPSLLLGGGK